MQLDTRSKSTYLYQLKQPIWIRSDTRLDPELQMLPVLQDKDVVFIYAVAHEDTASRTAGTVIQNYFQSTS